MQASGRRGLARREGRVTNLMLIPMSVVIFLLVLSVLDLWKKR